jgi:hypothetical protein|tara:strand:+ start:963 stop:1274 length:312 start_codon:yes stop_codon:yes gene_type:complete
MIGRAIALFLLAVILTAFFVPRAGAHELGCFAKEQSEIIEPKEWLRGYGTTSEGLVKLSISSSGTWMLTFSPPNLDGAICIVWLGENWQVVTGAGERAAWTAR